MTLLKMLHTLRGVCIMRIWPNMDKLDDEKLRRPRRPRLIYLEANLNQPEQKK